MVLAFGLRLNGVWDKGAVSRAPFASFHPSRFFRFIVNFQLAGFDLGAIYECEFLLDFAVAVGDQNVGI
jgi:hypothetical protein